MRRWPLVMAMTADDHRDEQEDQHDQFLEARCRRRAAAAEGEDRLLEVAAARRTGVAVASGMRATMPAMMMRLMPLPMPYSSICSPSHIRKTVPAVMVMTDDRASSTSRRRSPAMRQAQPAVVRGCMMYWTHDERLEQADGHGGVARVFVDLLRPALAFLLQLFQRRVDAGEELEDDRRRDVGHDAQAEDACAGSGCRRRTSRRSRAPGRAPPDCRLHRLGHLRLVDIGSGTWKPMR